jgi:tRNA(fMet)-specific endonuclease VapC
MLATLLDTDILSEILKRRNARVTTNASAYLREHGQFTFSVFTRFEIRRGYELRNAVRQLSRFEEFCSHCTVLPVTDAIFDRAAILWTEARRGGHPCSDADVLIAATALVHDLVLASGNQSHFEWVRDLELEDWRIA